jgi:hypothetical protein
MRLFGLKKPTNRGQDLGHYRVSPTLGDLDLRMDPMDVQEALAIREMQLQIENRGIQSAGG